MAIRAFPKNVLVQHAATALSAWCLPRAQRMGPLSVDLRYYAVCALAFGLVMFAFVAGLNWMRAYNEKTATLCYAYAHAAYVQDAYIAGQLSTLCLEYANSGTDQPKLLPFSVSGF